MHEGDAARFAGAMVEGRLTDLEPGSDRVVLGRTIAQMLAVGVGDSVTVLIPVTDASGTPEPKLREFTVAGVFTVLGALSVGRIRSVR